MRVSLNALLFTGFLGDLRLGMTKNEVQALLGEPDYWGGGSRRYKEPNIWVYGTVELYFNDERPRRFTGWLWEAWDKGAFGLGRQAEVADWAFEPGMAFHAVQEYLNERDLPMRYSEEDYGRAEHLTPLWVNDVTISFMENRLASVSVYWV